MIHRSDSTVQSNAEALIREKLARQLGKRLASKMLRLGGEAAVQVDAVALDESVLAEIFAHQGPLKGGQRRKIASDALKLITLGRDRPDAQLILAFADEQVAAYACGDGWLAQALAAWDVAVIVVDLNEADREELRAAQLAQEMRNAEEDRAGGVAASGGRNVVAVDASGYVPFEPRTSRERALREELGQRLSALSADRGEILHATFAGRLPNGVDIENVLLYNIAGKGAFAKVMDDGVAFELDPSGIEEGVHYRYAVAPPKPEFGCWQVIRELATLAADLDAQPALASIWWALRSTAGSIRQTGATRDGQEHFAMRLEVQGPARRLTPGLVKTILDGVVCSLQSQTDADRAALMAPLIAGTLDAPTSAVEEALTDPGPSVLGTRPRLVHARGTGVQWSSHDDRCVAAQVLFRAADRWRLAGNAAIVVPSRQAAGGQAAR